jgi:hypothetical protein
MIDIKGAEALAFFKSSKGMLPLIEQKIQMFADDWDEVQRKWDEKKGYWKRDTLLHLTGILDDLMKFGLTGLDPYRTNELVLFKRWRKPHTVENKWEHWEIMKDFIKQNWKRFEHVATIYAIRGYSAAHTGRPLPESVKFDKSDAEVVKSLLEDCLSFIRDSFVGGEEE